MDYYAPQTTFYNGILFRSKNEARWALFFDLCGIKYEYEHRTYEGFNGMQYKPDFYFPKYGKYAEVKSSMNALHNPDMERKLEAVIDYQATEISEGLILLGSFPYDVRIQEGLYFTMDYLFWHEGVVLGTAYIGENVITKQIEMHFREDYRDSGCPIPPSADPTIMIHKDHNENTSTKLFSIEQQVERYQF